MYYAPYSHIYFPQTERVQYFIEVALVLRQLGNFYGLFAVMLALTDPYVSRLRATWVGFLDGAVVVATFCLLTSKSPPIQHGDFANLALVLEPDILVPVVGVLHHMLFCETGKG